MYLAQDLGEMYLAQDLGEIYLTQGLGEIYLTGGGGGARQQCGVTSTLGKCYRNSEYNFTQNS